jgi:hypothetical protein
MEGDTAGMTTHRLLRSWLAAVLVVLAQASCGDESGKRTQDGGLIEACNANENFVSGKGCVPKSKAE